MFQIFQSKMVKSLRSLCLLKVARDGINYEDLPPGLAKDLNVMKVFNGNYRSEYDDEDNVLGLMTSLTILYDGMFWTFTYRSYCFNDICCNNYNYNGSPGSQPDLHQLTVAEEELVTVRSPVNKVRLAVLEHKFRGHQEQMEMKMTVKVGQDGMSGRICFDGGEGSVFNSIMQVDFNRVGTRVVYHSGDLYSDLREGSFVDRLYESRGWMG